MALDPNTELKPGQRISLPFETVNEIFALLSELPARQSMNLLLAIQQQAEIACGGEVEDGEE